MDVYCLCNDTQSLHTLCSDTASVVIYEFALM